MLNFRFPWQAKLRAPQAEIPKSFTVAGDKNQLLRFSMEETIADFVDIDYKTLTYAEVASMCRNKKQSSSVPVMVPRPKKVAPVAREEEVHPETVLEDLQEKLKVNNHFMKKVHKSSDRRKK